MIQDIYPDQFHNEYRPGARPGKDSPVLYYQGQKILARLIQEDEAGMLQYPAADSLPGELVYVFAVNETEYFLRLCGEGEPASHSISAPEAEDPEKELQVPANLQDAGFEWLDIRQIRKDLPNVCGMIVFTGYHLHLWYSGRRYCGACGHLLIHDPVERAMSCPVCGRKNYPRIMPAVIVGVINEDRILLTKYKEGYRYYALIAGFTEIGETLEETVAREVMEETGLRVKNIRYYKSQPWGIAGDVLAGFYCDVDGSTEIHMDRNELKVAEWKGREEIELQPDRYSLTNAMMRRFRDGEERMA